MRRRDFVRAAAAASGLLTARGIPLAALSAGSGTGGAVRIAGGTAARAASGPLYVPPTVSPDGLTLTARATEATLAPGVRSPILSLGDGPVAPTIRARVGEQARITLHNTLDEPTILHWHGLRPPEKDDGHPRLAIGPGGEYRYDFALDERAGTYWYHPHPHMRTAAQVHLGMVGLLILTDEAESALGLPDGEREIGLVLQDKRPDADGRIAYDVRRGHDVMEGLLGSAAYVNGVRQPEVGVDSALYRVRVLAAGHARIFRLALSNGRPLTLIGTDGGLLERPVSLPYLDLATGERADLLIDFSGLRRGERVVLRSAPFDAPSRGMGGRGMGGRGMGGRGMGGRGMGGGGNGGGGMGGDAVIPQGAAFDLLGFTVGREVQETAHVPARLSTIAPVDEAAVRTTREFVFGSAMMRHTINGRMFDMGRVDVTVPYGATERWTFINDGPFPHPVHMHAVQFRVVGRTGGRNRLFPWEQGWKDTVLVHPGERVSVVATFDAHRGRFLMHCHNLEHEDHGMMLNFTVA